MHYIHQDGKEVYKRAVRDMAEVSRLMLDRNRRQPPATWPCSCRTRPTCASWTPPPSAWSCPPERMASNIGDFANTTSATLPTALHQSLEAGKLKKGDLVVFAAFGAGFTWGGALMRWAV